MLYPHIKPFYHSTCLHAHSLINLFSDLFTAAHGMKRYSSLLLITKTFEGVNLCDMQNSFVISSINILHMQADISDQVRPNSPTAFSASANASHGLTSLPLPRIDFPTNGLRRPAAANTSRSPSVHNYNNLLQPFCCANSQ